MDRIRLSDQHGDPQLPGRADSGRQDRPQSDGDENAGADDAFDRLIQAIDHHATYEQEGVAQYGQLVREFTDPVLTQIMRMLAEDEARHHRLFHQMASLLRSEGVQAPLLASGHLASGLTRGREEAVIAMLRAAMDEEGRGARALEDLGRRERERCGGFISLLVELMALDSQKHERLLRFVLEQLRAEHEAAPHPPPDA